MVKLEREEDRDEHDERGCSDFFKAVWMMEVL